MFEKDYYDFRKMCLTLDRIEDKIKEVEGMVKTLEQTIKGSIDYNDRIVEKTEVSNDELDKLFERLISEKENKLVVEGS
jgi:hypothetical protein